MRFPEFSEEWERFTLGSIGETFNGLTGKSAVDFGSGSPYITYKSIFDCSKVDVSKVEYVRITETERAKYTQNEVEYGDIFFTTSSETPEEVGMASVLLTPISDCYLNSFCFGYRLFDKQTCLPDFFRFYFRSRNIRRKIAILAQGSTRFNISKNEVMKMSIFLPLQNEQRKISKLLTLVEERIETQRRIIEKYESLIKGIRYKLLTFNSSVRICKLKDICKITTGKLDANAMEEGGVYPFFTCAEVPFSINTYAFDTEALLVSGNGANVGYINYCNGKFNAYQRTYVLYDFSIDIHYVRYYLDAFLKQRIDQEKNIGNTPYIVLSTLADMMICIPPPSRQLEVCRVIKAMETKLTLEKNLYYLYQRSKNFILRNMFI